MAEYMERLSRFVSDTRLQDLDPADIAAAKAVVLDTIGAILAEASSRKTATWRKWLRRPEGAALRRYLGAKPRCRQCSPPWSTPLRG